MDFTSWLQTYVPIILGILSILGIIFGFIAKVTQKTRMFIREEVQEVAKELKPNGGSSLRDQVNRLEEGHQKLEEKVDTIITYIIDKRS